MPWAIAALAVIALAWTWWDGRQRDGQAMSGGDVAATTGDQARQDLPEASRLEGPVRGITRSLPPSTGQDATSIRERVTGDRPTTGTELAAERERLLQQMEGRFAADAPDPVGGPAAELRLSEAAVGEVMAPTGIAPSELKVDCKSSMCRVQGVFDSPGNAQDWGMFYLGAAGGELGSSRIIHQRQPDGSIQLSIYATRSEPPR